jgi:hypothetical protein
MPTLFEYQLDMLKLEVETINQSIRQMDEITKSIKEWTVGLWTAAIGGALVKPELANYIWVTVAIPLVFWLVDTWYRRIQRKFIFRGILIARFLNGERLEQSFTEGKLVGFSLLDPKSRSEASAEYEDFIAPRKVAFFPSVALLYLGLVGMSLLVWWLAPR